MTGLKFSRRQFVNRIGSDGKILIFEKKFQLRSAVQSAEDLSRRGEYDHILMSTSRESMDFLRLGIMISLKNRVACAPCV